MSIKAQQRKLLWTRARNLCAFPSCRQSLTEDIPDASSGEAVATVVGQEAHIRSSKPDGPRHDPKYAKSKLDTYENLILLCPTHHVMVDADNGAGYTVDGLITMRKRHERRQQHRERVDATMRAYLADRYRDDDTVRFEQIELSGPSVDTMFVDVPFMCRPDAPIAATLAAIARVRPGDVDIADPDSTTSIVTGAAQALLHPHWSGNALLVGGPGQGKSTLLQYVCQFHRSRILDRPTYTGVGQKLSPLTPSRGIRSVWTCGTMRRGRSTTRRRRQAPNHPFVVGAVAHQRPSGRA